MKVLITGAAGQLGSSLGLALGADNAILYDRIALDITDRQAVMKIISASQADIVVHCAAMTDVEGCAQLPTLAYQINALGTQNVALACARAAIEMAYISTNEVFDGTAAKPYKEWSTIGPINPYARSKAAGEWFVSHLMQRFYIVRTSWLYSSTSRNFPYRVIERANHALPLRVVSDEVSNPTYVPDLADALISLIQTKAYGIYHLTNTNHCSRYDFARALLREYGHSDIIVTPIRQEEFKRKSTPPKFSALANTAASALGITLRPWEEALHVCLRMLKVKTNQFTNV